jgi:hypothetical protein
MMQVRVDYEREIGHPDAETGAAYLEQLRQRLAASADEPHAAEQSNTPAEQSDEG